MPATAPLVPRAAWDPRFDVDRPWYFAPLRAAAARFRAFARWPEPDEWNAALADEPELRAASGLRVRFVAQGPRPSRGRRRADAAAGITRESLYDGRIYTAGEVPSRPRTWHDFFNMLVWASFPRAKRAVNARQYAAAAAHFPRGAPRARLPGARTREQDALAMLDEGGLLVLACEGARDALADALGAAAEVDGARGIGALVRAGRAAPLVFGHALYEHLVSSRDPVRACVAVLHVPGDTLPAERVALADARLAARLADPREFTTPAALPGAWLTDALFVANE